MTADVTPRKGFSLPKASPAMLAWLGLLGFCLLIGLVAAVEVFWKGLAITHMSDLVPWGLWITIDLSAIALGAGAFTLSAIVYIFGLKHFQPIVRLAVWIGFIGYTSALLTLVMDIGRPDRFWHPWAFWNVHSVLWEITWCITIYLIVMALEFAPVVADARLFDNVRHIGHVRQAMHLLHKLAPALAVLGLAISLLHQSSLGATYGIVKSRPIWFKPSMPIMFILSAVAAGPALTMTVAFLVEWVTGKRKVPRDVLRTIARFSGLAFLAYGYIKFWDLASVAYYGRTPLVSEALFTLSQQTPYNFSFWVGEVGLGIIVPAAFFLTPRFSRSPLFLVAGGLSGMLGIIVHRWNVTVSGLFVPVAYSPGTLYHLPAGQYWPSLVEWGVAVGIIGYALLLLTLGVKFLPLFDGEKGPVE
ncbi:MAG: NrfD/PsrC family molybdoenzyme membrane anchor subunit [Chloroflexota bacterium]